MPIAIKRVTCCEIRVNYLSGSPGRTESSCQMRSGDHPKSCVNSINRVNLLNEFWRNVRLVYCPSRNRTCGFPAYGSSNSRLTPVPYIGRQMRLGDIVIPHSQILFVSESAFLVASVQYPVCRIFKILP